METNKLCPNCQKPLPADVPMGLCPECLIKSGFPTETQLPPIGQAAGPRFVPPPAAEVAQLFPQLEIIELIGQGGMGAVYKARQPALGRSVALKILPPAVAEGPGFAERFNREARALALLSHPNIVAIHDFGKVGTLHYLLMEFVDGTNLRQLEQAGRLTPDQALAIVPQICEALQFAHNEGIVHRDIKPENILLNKKGRVKITDFGIAKIIGVTASNVSLTGVKDIVGTPHYMAPEQIEQPQSVDHRADIYSLGVVFYEMLTGELPLGKFAAPSEKAKMDVRLDEVVMHSLEKQPERRYQQASEVKTDVETISRQAAPPPGGVPPQVPPVGAVPPLPPRPDPRVITNKTILPAFLLAFFFGIFGAHRFYVGKIGTGILQLFTFGGFGIWTIIDWILILCKSFTDKNGVRITRWFYPEEPLIPEQKSEKIILPAFLLALFFGFFGAHRFYAGKIVSGIFQLITMGGCGIWAMADFILIACQAFTDSKGKRMTRWIHREESATKPRVRGPSGGSSAPPIVPSSPDKTKNMIAACAAGLMVASAYGLFSALKAFEGFEILARSPLPFHWNHYFSAVVVVLKSIPPLLILYGAIEMLQVRNYVWAFVAAILAIVSCSLVGTPIGIWALIVLVRPDVKAAFTIPSTFRWSGKLNWPWIIGGAGAALFLLILGHGILRATTRWNETNNDTTPFVSTTPVLNDVTPVQSSTTPQTDDATANSAAKSFELSDQTSFSKSLDVEPDGKLTIHSERGSIRVTGADQNNVDVQIDRTVTRASNPQASEILREEHLILKQNGNEISISSHDPPSLYNHSVFGWLERLRRPNLDVHYEITVPKKFAVHLETSGGDIKVAGLSSVVKVKTEGGSLDFSDIGGPIDGQTAGGSIQASGCQDDLIIQTFGGGITIGHFSGPHVRATTEGGSISADFSTAPTTDSELHTAGGSISARLPSLAALTLDAHTLGGSVKTDLPVQVEGQVQDSTLKGTINGGGPTLKLETMGGSIEILKQ
jgi:TM2 domain-containing membrane protein YozV/predicted Ser/Thr protein kinase